MHSAEHEKVRKSSCTIYVVLIAIIFTINMIIGTYFVYYKCMNRNKENVSRYDYVYQTTSYQYKWEILKRLALKIEHITFLMIWLIFKILMQAY